jgi:Phage protein Gp138 N-terminal domain
MYANNYEKTIRDLVDGSIRRVNTSMPGNVETAVCQDGRWIITAKPFGTFSSPSGENIPYPVVTGVPVVFPSGDGGKASMTWPIKRGDGVLQVFSQRQIEDFMANAPGQSKDVRAYDMTDGIAIPGLLNTGVQGAMIDPMALVLSYGEAYLKIPEGGPIQTSVDIVIAGISFDAHVHPDAQGGYTGPPVGGGAIGETVIDGGTF